MIPVFYSTSKVYTRILLVLKYDFTKKMTNKIHSNVEFTFSFTHYLLVIFSWNQFGSTFFEMISRNFFKRWWIFRATTILCYLEKNSWNWNNATWLHLENWTRFREKFVKNIYIFFHGKNCIITHSVWRKNRSLNYFA